MIATLWANQIIDGKKTFAQAPRLLREKIEKILIDSGYEDLATE